MKKVLLIGLLVFAFITAVYAGCDNPAFQGKYNATVVCTGGSITVSAYLNNTLVNTVRLSIGQRYTFYRQNSSQTLKLKICWPSSGGYYRYYYF